jgi:U6 snRNA-associated Sm-like protein LSm1
VSSRSPLAKSIGARYTSEAYIYHRFTTFQKLHCSVGRNLHTQHHWNTASPSPLCPCALAMHNPGEDGLSAVASLIEELDKRLLVVLRDGRHYIGILRSFDQFSNIVLEECVERVVVDNCYADVPLGTYVVRGENVVLLGNLGDDDDSSAGPAPPLSGHRLVSTEHIRQAQKAEQESSAIRRRLLKGSFDFLDE